ncbi:MAG: hypothetical protein ACREAK_05155 [Nitrosarchaeum sp.]
MKTRLLTIIGIPVTIAVGLFFWIFTTENEFEITSNHGSDLPNFSESLFTSLMKGFSPYDQQYAFLYAPHYWKLFLIVGIILSIWFVFIMIKRKRK